MMMMMMRPSEIHSASCQRDNILLSLSCSLSLTEHSRRACDCTECVVSEGSQDTELVDWQLRNLKRLKPTKHYNLEQVFSWVLHL